MENEANKVERFVKLHPPVEGKLLDPANVDVGHRMRVRLVHVSVERGFIDFETAS